MASLEGREGMDSDYGKRGTRIRQDVDEELLSEN